MRLPRPVSKARILIVEDDAALAEVLDYNLSQAGHQTQVVRDGQPIEFTLKLGAWQTFE